MNASDVDQRGASGPRGDAWQLLVDSASDAYVSIDDAGLVTHWNTPAAALFGWTREEALGRQLAELIIPPEHRDAHLLGIQRFVATGRGEAVFRRLQLPALHRTGRRVEVEFTILPVEDQETGWHFHAFLRDVTAELAQQRYVRLLEATALAANEATTVEGAVRACLQATQELTASQFAHAWLVDEDTGTVVPTGWWSPEPPDEIRRATAETIFPAGVGLPGRVTEAGKPAWIPDITEDDNFPRAAAATASGLVAAFAFPVVTRDRTVGVIELFRHEAGEPEDQLLDVMRSVGTQLGRVFERQRAYDDVVRLAADREAVVSIVGHELRGPLGAARAAAELLTTDDGDEQLAAVLHRQLGRLRRLVDMFLTAQHLESGSLILHPQPVALAPLVREVISDGDFSHADVTIAEDLEVLADPDHVAQILWNLLGNASRHGAPPITVVAEPRRDGVTVTVADTGPGVPPDVRPRLFDRFARGPESRGTGLGLSIVRGLARSNGGDVAYLHDTGSGPAFVVQLPAPR